MAEHIHTFFAYHHAHLYKNMPMQYLEFSEVVNIKKKKNQLKNFDICLFVETIIFKILIVGTR